MYRIIIAICAVVFAAQASFGQGPPTYADTPIFLGLQGRGLRAFGKFVFKENATISVMPVAIPYNLRTDLLIGGVLPLVRKSLNGIDSQTGLGDASVFIKYLILQKDRAAKTFRVALKFRETFPTGNSTRPLALGLGAYQTYTGLVGAYITTRLGLYVELGYNRVSENFDDNVVYNMALGIPFLPVGYPPKQINFYLGINGSSLVGRNRNTLFISPAVQFIPAKRFLLEGGVQIPLAEDIPDAEKTNIIFTLGTRVLIF